MKTIALTRSAARDLDALPATAREAVTNALHGYAMTGKGDVRKLAGENLYRMRVGRYRIIFDEDQTTILAIRIGARQTTTYGKR